MATTVEDEVVAMKFDNRQFESGVNQSIGSINKLKGSLRFEGTANGLDEISRKANGVNFSPMQRGIAGITSRLTAMKVIGISALATLASRATVVGLGLVHTFAINPIKAGFESYEQQINATKTILANTAASGTKLPQVTATLKELNQYANLTIYNFAEMAKNIGTFTAAGVALKPATAAIKGIANLAALSGSNTQQASSAMYQLSQAIAAGQVKMQDWNSVVNAGIGGTVFQRALANTAVAMGTLQKSQVKLSGSMKNVSINGAAFRNSLTPPPGGTGWLTSKVLTATLSQFTGDLKEGTLVAQGFTKAQAKAIIQQGKTALNAATQIKTFTQLMQALKEEVASSWAQVFKAIFGNINEATKTFSALHNVIENALRAPVNNIAKFLTQFRKFGGFTATFQGIVNIFHTLGNIITPFEKGIEAIFPSSKKGGSGLASLAKGFEHVTGWMEKLSENAKYLTPILVAIGHGIRQLFVLAAAAVRGLAPLVPIFKELASAAGDFLKQGLNIANNLIRGLLQGLSPGAIKAAIFAWATSIVDYIKQALGIHSPAATMVPVGENIVLGIVQGVEAGATWLFNALGSIAKGIVGFFKAIASGVSGQDVVALINTGFFIALYIAARKFFKSFGELIESFSGVGESIKGTFEQLTSNLKTMQQNVKANIILKIAIAVGILAASVALLASIDPKKMAAGLAAVGTMVAGMTTAMTLMGGGGKGKHIDTKAVARQIALLNGTATAMVAFAGAILVLSAAVAVLGHMKTDTLEKGITSVMVLMGSMVAATRLIKGGAGGTILAAAAAMAIMAEALIVLSGAIVLYSKLNMKTLAEGIGKAAAAVTVLGLSLKAFGTGSVGGAAALVIAAGGLIVLALALKLMGTIKLGTLAKDMVTIAVALGLLAVGLDAMTGSLAGAAALVVAATGLIALAIALKLMGSLGVGTIVKAILAIAGAIVVISAVAAALSEAIPFVAGFAIALGILGAAMLAAGAGMALFAIGLATLAASGAAGFAVLAAGVVSLAGLIPLIAQQIGLGIVAIAVVISKAGPQLFKAFATALNSLLDAITSVLPKLAKLIKTLIRLVISIIVSYYKDIAKAGINLILFLLHGIAQAIPKIAKAGADVIIAFINAIADQSVRIANAAGAAILRFIKGLTAAINKYAPQIRAAGLELGVALVNGMTGGMASKARTVVDKAKSIAQSALDAVKKPWKVFSPSKATREMGGYFTQGLALGISDHGSKVNTAAEDVANNASNALKAAFKKTRVNPEEMMDLSPKVTPVLDLSQLSKDASKIGSHVGSVGINAKLDRSKAQDIADSHAAQHGKGHGGGGDTKLEFKQTINSPTPLTPAKIYRQTKSQLALAKKQMDQKGED